MIERKAQAFLQDWKRRSTRKPLVVRGARQVGKTRLVVDLFGKREFDNVLEINFELQRAFAEYFRSNDPAKIVPLLEAATGIRVTDGRTLLFLDEIQAAPQVLESLRYFHERRPGLHVVAAGSLLEFALEDFGHSMPVGRVEYLFILKTAVQATHVRAGAHARAEKAFSPPSLNG